MTSRIPAAGEALAAWLWRSVTRSHQAPLPAAIVWPADERLNQPTAGCSYRLGSCLPSTQRRTAPRQSPCLRALSSLCSVLVSTRIVPPQRPAPSSPPCTPPGPPQTGTRAPPFPPATTPALPTVPAHLIRVLLLGRDVVPRLRPYDALPPIPMLRSARWLRKRGIRVIEASESP